jgi:hypothetical protein
LIARINQAWGGAPVTRVKVVAAAPVLAPGAGVGRVSDAPPPVDGSLEAALTRLRWHLERDGRRG